MAVFLTRSVVFFFTQNVGTSNSKVHKFPQNRHHRRASLVRILFETFLMETFHPFFRFAQLRFFYHSIFWNDHTPFCGRGTRRASLLLGPATESFRTAAAQVAYDLSNAHAVVVHSQGRELAEYSSHESRNVLPNVETSTRWQKKQLQNCKSYIAYFLKMRPPNKKKTLSEKLFTEDRWIHPVFCAKSNTVSIHRSD